LINEIELVRTRVRVKTVVPGGREKQNQDQPNNGRNVIRNQYVAFREVVTWAKGAGGLKQEIDSGKQGGF